MAFYRKSGGGNIAPATVKRRSGGGWADVQTIKRRSGGSWVTVWSAYTPMTVTAYGVDDNCPASTAGFITISASASATDGNPSKTYSWTFVSGASFTINTPTGANTGFTQAGKPPAGTYSGTYRVTVSDGTSAAYKDVTVTITRF